ncbi:Hsp70 family protein [Bradyrhizobium sp. CCGUVB14]|uniref:Hsp70 family protein n=1 Tax=Bradyrhizobium sp. CCGUVB14 TaxID=2949628 RepID=UPI0020B3C671|nr:Hsp70 family protein [Bradyrhizobium sp. CCGUVB14]MCP3441495.1 Hsp70 family protein [Bradyrhizobium sp. CCGUVB14]
MSETIVGIDLGTTNSEIAVYRDGRPEVQADGSGRLILPSVVGLDQDGSLLVGEAARNQYILYPERTVRSIKRLMGSDRKVSLGDRNYAPQDVSAMILRRLKEIAEERLGAPVRKAVITVPAFFSDAQRQATREAGEIAGFEVARIVNEPTAAALVYEAAQQQGKRVLVYDLGGGTFDVSVVRIEEGVVEVIASHGNNHLGGDDFDHKIVEHVLDHLRIEHKADVSDDPQAMARIHRASENAKKHLSDHPFARIEEEYLAEVSGKPVHLALELARADYEEMIAPFIEETLSAIHIALESAALTASQIEEVLLVGGATRTPLIRDRLFEVFGRQARGEVDPDLCVAMGAAIQGASMAGEKVPAVLVDVTPYTFGTGALGELGGTLYPYCFIPIIPKNTPIPVRKSEAFATIIDDQKVVEVRIYQGENEDALENIQIGEFRVEDLADVPAGNTIILDLALDRDGILHISAKEKATGLERRITIDNAMSRYDKAEIKEARQHIDRLFGGSTDETVTAADVEGTAPVDPKLEALLAKARARLDGAVAEDRTEIVDLIETIEDSRVSGDDARLADTVLRLDDLLFYLET